MKKLLLVFLVIVAGLVAERACAQNVALKSNALYWLTTSPNLGLEIGLNPKLSLELAAVFNPWTFSDDRKMRFWLAQPELRYWPCERFEGHFYGLHLHGAQYFGGFHSKRYDGYLAGGGFTYGYNWILSPHWNLEAAVGLGYAHLWYKQSPRTPCLKCRTHERKNYVGPTKVAVSLVYMF